jgi:hypothetical protein
MLLMVPKFECPIRGCAWVFQIKTWGSLSAIGSQGVIQHWNDLIIATFRKEIKEKLLSSAILCTTLATHIAFDKIPHHDVKGSFLGHNYFFPSFCNFFPSSLFMFPSFLGYFPSTICPPPCVPSTFFFHPELFSDTPCFRRAWFRKIATIHVRVVGPFTIFWSCPSPHALCFCREAQRKGLSPDSDKDKDSKEYKAVQENRLRQEQGRRRVPFCTTKLQG